MSESRLIDKFEGIKTASLEIAYDNGMINIQSSEEKFLQETEEVLKKYQDRPLQAWDEWLLSISPSELNTVCCGEYSDMQKVMSHCPSGEGLGSLLNDIFES